MASSLVMDSATIDNTDFFQRHQSTVSWHETSACQSQFCSATSQEDFPLHFVVFHGDIDKVKQLCNPDLINSLDTHGNTPLHIAIMKGYSEIVNLLLKMDATLNLKNCDGWLALDEAVSYGDREMIAAIIKMYRAQYVEGLVSRKLDLLQKLSELDDFYLELKWEFHTWVPFLSRLLPSDLCRVHKCGSKIRMDCTLMDFNEMAWQRGDLSFVFNGQDQKDIKNFMVTIMDNKKKEFSKIKLLGGNGNSMESDINEQIDFLMGRPSVYANMSTKPIKVLRAQSGFLFFRSDKTEMVGDHDAKVYDITDLILTSRRRTEHLSSEDKKQHEQMRKKIETGDISSEDIDVNQNSDDSSTEHEQKESLPPPLASNVTWEQYIGTFDTPEKRRLVHLGRPLEYKEERKYYKASVSIAESCPLDMSKLLDILELIAPYKHFQKLRNFVQLKLLPDEGFPVKLNIPIFPTVTAIVTMEKYEMKRPSDDLFTIPLDYKKHESKEKSRCR